MYQWDREITTAKVLAREAGLIALKYWKDGVVAETKPDASPVTIADKEAERAISRAIEEAFPEDGLLGEEGSSKKSRNGRRWIIDPIDGTRDFVRGNRAWSILIGLEAAGEVVAGVSYFPALDELFSAVRGAGADCNGAPIHASAISDPAQAVLCLNGLKRSARRTSPTGCSNGWSSSGRCAAWADASTQL